MCLVLKDALWGSSVDIGAVMPSIFFIASFYWAIVCGLPKPASTVRFTELYFVARVVLLWLVIRKSFYVSFNAVPSLEACSFLSDYSTVCY